MPDYTWDDLLSWTPSYAATVSTQVDAQAPKKEDEWDKILGWEPLKVERPQKSRLQESLDLAKRSQEGPAPSAFGVAFPSAGQITDLVRQRAAGFGDIANVDLGKTWGNIKQQAPQIIPGMVKSMGEAVAPLINPAEFFMGNPLDIEAAKRYREAGIAQPQTSPTGPARPIKAMADLVMYLPELGKEFIENPKETIENRGLEILLVLSGKGVHSAKKGLNKLRKSPLTTEDLQASFKETLANPKKFNLAPQEVEAVDYLSRAIEEPGTVYGEGGAVIGRNVPEIRRAEPRPTGPTPMPEGAEFARPELTDMRVAEAPQKPVSPGSQAVEQLSQPQTPGGGYPPTGETVPPQIRQPGPGEVRGLGIEFVNKEGKPISRAEAMAVKREPPVGEAQGIPPVSKPLSPEAASQPPMVREFFDAIKAAKKLTPKQKNLYSIERKQRLAQALQEGKRLGGRAGYEAQMKALSGSLERVEFETPKITQEHADALFQYIEDSPALVGFDKIAAKNGLAKMLGEKGAGIPQPKELSLLKDVFGPEIVTTAVGKKPWWIRAKDVGVDLLNVPRALVTSADLSFGLRQGIYYMARHPAKFWKEFPNQAKWFSSEKAAKAVRDNIRARETYPLMREAGLDIIGAEEPFQSSIAEKIPVVGPVVKASNRTYSTFATKLRADSFDNLVNIARKAKRDPFSEPQLAKDMAEFVNTTTGRGDLGRLERISKELNAAFFSPKLMASRLQTLNPKFYIKLDPLVRKEALTNLAAFAGYGATVVGLSKLAGLEVGINPTSADFGKIKVGNTRIDLLGGYSQYVRIASQLITQKVTSTTSGKVIKLGEGYKPTTSMDVLLRGIEAKEAPVFSFATGLFKGQNWIGEKFNVSKEAANRFIPMVIQDFVDIYKDDPSLFPLGFLGVFGAGLQTYKPRQPKKLY